MKAELLQLVCCPVCRVTLQIEAAEELDSEIWEGVLFCAACSSSFPIHQGMPHLYIDDVNWRPKAREAEGWVTYHKDLDIFETMEDSVDLKIPYYPEEPWISVARGFDIALTELKLSGNESILDLGAGRGWAAKEFAKLGCRVVALDVVPDQNVGLGRAKALMNHAGVYFDRIIADGENLPFFTDSFDIVFCAATLHHSSRLALLCQNIETVLKPKGRLCAINEPCISIVSNEQHVLERDAQHEIEVGINETRPNLLDYFEALHGAGLTLIALFQPVAHGLEPHALKTWAVELGVLLPKPSLSAPQRSLWLIQRYLRQRASAFLNGSYLKLARLSPEIRNRLESRVLLWHDGELFLMAQKTNRQRSL